MTCWQNWKSSAATGSADTKPSGRYIKNTQDICLFRQGIFGIHVSKCGSHAEMYGWPNGMWITCNLYATMMLRFDKMLWIISFCWLLPHGIARYRCAATARAASIIRRLVWPIFWPIREDQWMDRGASDGFLACRICCKSDEIVQIIPRKHCAAALPRPWPQLITRRSLVQVLPPQPNQLPLLIQFQQR